MAQSLWIKICGITTVHDAELAVEAGADALGVNFVPESPRSVDAPRARDIVKAVGARVEVVAVVADRSVAELRELRQGTGIEWLQLHGSERPEQLSSLLPRAYKAIGIANPGDVEQARSYPGERLLVDAKVAGRLGGTGQRFDWELVRQLVGSRPVILAGGLDPDNVADAMSRLGPWGVDVASGVERPARPGEKDPDRVRDFVERARAAWAASG